MRFTCDRCGKGYVTRDVPLPGRTYRLRCKACGNVLVVKGPEATAGPSDRSEAPPPAPPEVASPIPSNVTPLADLVPPMPPAATSGPAAASAADRGAASTESEPEPTPPPAAPGEPRYIELFDEKDFASDDASPSSRPTPTPTPLAVVAPPPIPGASPPAAAAPGGVPTPPAGRIALTEEEFREAAESLRQSLVTDDPFERARDAMERSRDPFSHTDGAPEARTPPASPLEAAEPLRLSPAPRPSPPPAPPARDVVRTRPARKSRRGLAVAMGAIAVLLVAGAGAVFLWPGLAGRDTAPARLAPRPAPTPAPAPSPPRASTVPAKPAAPATAEPPAPATTHAPAPEPAAAPLPAAAPEPPPAPAAAAAEPPPPAAQPAPKHPAPKPAPPPRPPPKAAEKAPRPAKAAEPKVASASRQEPAEPAAAASPPSPPPAASPAQPEAGEPEGLTPEQIQKALRASRKALDDCLRDPWRGLEQPLGARQVTLRLTVAPEGTVNYPTIDDVAISSAPVGQCLKTAARGLTFPSFQGDPVKVDVPINIPAK